MSDPGSRWRAFETGLRALGAAAVELVWPRTCAGCAAPGELLCRACRGRDVPAVLDELTAGPAVPVVAGAAYGGGVRRALIAYKERRRFELARPLGLALRAAVDHLLAPGAVDRPFSPPSRAGVLLVPVPSTAAARTRRGDDHVRRLARAARRRGDPPVGRLLRGSGAGERTETLAPGIAERLGGAGRYRARAPAAGERRTVVVVDDVVTTGATARDAVAALRAAGWTVLGVAAVAATPRGAPPRLPGGGATLSAR